MGSKAVLAILFVLALGVAAPVDALQRVASRRPATTAATPNYDDLGPELRGYMGFIDDEEAEVQHLFEEGEVSKEDYKETRDRLAATRMAVLRVARERAEDIVPELYVLRAGELTQVLPTGLSAIRGKRAGQQIDADWLYHGTIRHGDLFYVLERTSTIERLRPY